MISKDEPYSIYSILKNLIVTAITHPKKWNFPNFQGWQNLILFGLSFLRRSNRYKPFFDSKSVRICKKSKISSFLGNIFQRLFINQVEHFLGKEYPVQPAIYSGHCFFWVPLVQLDPSHPSGGRFTSFQTSHKMGWFNHRQRQEYLYFLGMGSDNCLKDVK